MFAVSLKYYDISLLQEFRFMKSWMKSPNSTLNLNTTEDTSGGGTVMEPSKRRYFVQSATKNPFDEKPDEDENEDFFAGSLVIKVYLFSITFFYPLHDGLVSLIRSLKPRCLIN